MRGQTGSRKSKSTTTVQATLKSAICIPIFGRSPERPDLGAGNRKNISRLFKFWDDAARLLYRFMIDSRGRPAGPEPVPAVGVGVFGGFL
jgi:hypothetical protein